LSSATSDPGIKVHFPSVTGKIKSFGAQQVLRQSNLGQFLTSKGINVISSTVIMQTVRDDHQKYFQTGFGRFINYPLPQ